MNLIREENKKTSIRKNERNQERIKERNKIKLKYWELTMRDIIDNKTTQPKWAKIKPDNKLPIPEITIKKVSFNPWTKNDSEGYLKLKLK